MAKKYIIWGATGQSIVVEEALFQTDYQLIAVFDNNESIKSPFENVPLYYGKKGFEDWKKNISSHEEIYFTVAIGGPHGRIRVELHNYLMSQGLKPFNVIHKTANVARNASLGTGLHILAGSTVSARAVVKDCVIVNTSASVDHECVLEEGTHVGPAAALAGNVTAERYSFIGTNATVLPRIKIGENSIIGAGSVVTKDVSSYSTVAGNPARLIKQQTT